jgi:hypothetical protein
MSQTLRPYPDMTDVIFNLVGRDMPGTFQAMVTSLNDVAENLPLLRSEVVGGSGGRLNRVSVVDSEVFASTYAEAKSLSESLSAYLLGYPRSVLVGDRVAVVDMVVETRPPVELPWDDSNIRRFAATHSISVRR